MKIYIIIGIILLLFVPIIPYENEIQDGVTVIENRSVAEWVWENYQITQTNNKERSEHVKNQSDKTP